MKTTLALSFLLAACLQAGNINLVNLVTQDSTQFTLSLGGGQESFELATGAFSGKFQLEGEAKVTCREAPGLELVIKDSKDSQLALFHNAGGKPEWRLLPSKPTDGVLSLRVINLEAEPATIEINGHEATIAPDKIHSVEKIEGNRISLLIRDGEVKQNFNPPEPRAGLAIVFKEGGEWKIFVIPDI